MRTCDLIARSVDHVREFASKAVADAVVDELDEIEERMCDETAINLLRWDRGEIP